MKETDVIVIGGGVLGISLAYHLGRRGKTVLLLEREIVPAMHASGKNAGMIRTLYRHPQLTQWAIQSIQSWPKEIQQTFFQTTGSLVVGRDVPDHHQELFQQREHSDSAGTSKNAVYSAVDGLLDSPGYVNYLYSICDASKVHRRLATKAVSIESENDDWLVTCEDGENMRAPILVNAGGAWVNEILLQNHPWLKVDVQAYARHLLLVHGWPENWMPCDDIGFFWEESAGWYMRRWDKDSRLVSICDETPAVPEQFVPSGDIANQTAEKLLASLPSFAEGLRIGTSWHCFRTYTEDQLPIIGKDPEHSSLYWIAAFGGFGMSTGFAAAQDLAKDICGGSASIPKEFLPTRARPSSSRSRRIAV